MSELKATPGPWAATTRRGSWDWVVCKALTPSIEICQIFHDGTDLNPTGEANAHLIASAPKLYDALQTTTVHLIAAISLLRKIHDDLAPSKRHALFSTKLADYEKASEAGRAALAKARGDQ